MEAVHAGRKTAVMARRGRPLSQHHFDAENGRAGNGKNDVNGRSAEHRQSRAERLGSEERCGRRRKGRERSLREYVASGMFGSFKLFADRRMSQRSKELPPSSKSRRLPTGFHFSVPVPGVRARRASRYRDRSARPRGKWLARLTANRTSRRAAGVKWRRCASSRPRPRANEPAQQESCCSSRRELHLAVRMTTFESTAGSRA